MLSCVVGKIIEIVPCKSSHSEKDMCRKAAD